MSIRPRNHAQLCIPCTPKHHVHVQHETSLWNVQWVAIPHKHTATGYKAKNAYGHSPAFSAESCAPMLDAGPLWVTFGFIARVQQASRAQLCKAQLCKVYGVQGSVVQGRARFRCQKPFNKACSALEAHSHACSTSAELRSQTLHHDLLISNMCQRLMRSVR
jgi:hypothetical protein